MGVSIASPGVEVYRSRLGTSGSLFWLQLQDSFEWDGHRLGRSERANRAGATSDGSMSLPPLTWSNASATYSRAQLANRFLN